MMGLGTCRRRKGCGVGLRAQMDDRCCCWWCGLYGLSRRRRGGGWFLLVSGRLCCRHGLASRRLKEKTARACWSSNVWYSPFLDPEL